MQNPQKQLKHIINHYFSEGKKEQESGKGNKNKIPEIEVRFGTKGIKPISKIDFDNVVKKLKWKIWILGILSSLILAGIVGAIVNKNVEYDYEKNGTPGFLVMAAGIIITYFIQKNKVNKILNESKARRQEILKNLQKPIE